MDSVLIDKLLPYSSRVGGVLAGCPGGGDFRAKPCDDASVAWINRDWFSEHGWDVRSGHGYEVASEWVLRHFALELDTVAGVPVPANGQDEPQYVIDGYGTTSLARYGGSGRAGILGDFQVKGIGRTPFAATNADWHHSHGYLWLEEGLREAVFSEVCRHEAPCGAVPVVAVILLQEHISAPDGGLRQRALLLRPFHIRPAHLQRALLLERSDLEGLLTPHMQDAARVSWHVNRLQQETGDVWRWLESLVVAYGRQAAYSHTSGWFSGGLTSSNLTIDGEFIDFGSARFVPDGRALAYEGFGQRFGDELETASAVLHSIVFYLRKYAGNKDGVVDVQELLMRSYRRELARHTARLLGMNVPEQAAGRIAGFVEQALSDLRAVVDGAAAVAREQQAMRLCAELLACEGSGNPREALERWHTIRYRERATREAVQAEIGRVLMGDVRSWQAKVDSLVCGHKRLNGAQLEQRLHPGRERTPGSTIYETRIDNINGTAVQWGKK